MKFVVGNFKNKLDLNQTKTLLEKYNASFLKLNKVGLCVQNEYYKDVKEFNNIEIYCNNIDLKEINKNVQNNCYLIGHFDHRSTGENNKLVIKKAKRLLKFGAKIIMCVGDTLDEFNCGLSQKSIRAQLKGITKNPNLIIAYEPFYAIGSSSAADIQEVTKTINFIKSLFLGNVTVLYGGAIDPTNAKQFLKSPFIDGVLVGRASLDYLKFIELTKLA